MLEKDPHEWEDIGNGWRIREAKDLYSELQHIIAYGSWLNSKTRDVYEMVADKLVAKGFTEDEAVDMLNDLYLAALEEENSLVIYEKYHNEKNKLGADGGKDI